MTAIDLSKPSKVYFIGIGGISMSGFAQLLAARGFTVYGSDRKESAVTDILTKSGITVYYGQRAENIPDDIDVVIYTGAVKEDNPELVKARSLGVPVLERGSLAGDIMLHYKNNYSIAGTHGKTTTTSMLSMILLEAGADPTISVGSVLTELKDETHIGNFRIGGCDNMVIESCEYTDSFLKFHPTKAIITGIEAEHLDYFKTLENERASFAKFAELLPETGLLMINSEIPDHHKLFSSVKCPILTYNARKSDDDTDYYAEDISYDSFGCGRYTLFGKKEGRIGRIELSVIGEHNIINSIAAAAVALSAGIPFEKIANGLKRFVGSARRFEKKGVFNGATVIDDYAHHPTEIAVTLKAARNYPGNRLTVVFQPHTYSRTASFLKEIAEALAIADRIILADIYAARELNTYNVSSENIAEILASEYSKEVYYFSEFSEIEDYLRKNCQPGELLITMGAGDIVLVGESLVSR